MRILVIEDNRVMARIVERCLEQGGFTDYTVVSSSEEALDQLEQADYDLLILDWMLPGISGLDFARALRRSKRYGAIPIIMQTAKDHPEHIKRAAEAGINDYVIKPLNGRSLLDKVGKYAGSSSNSLF